MVKKGYYQEKFVNEYNKVQTKFKNKKNVIVKKTKKTDKVVDKFLRY